MRSSMFRAALNGHMLLPPLLKSKLEGLLSCLAQSWGVPFATSAVFWNVLSMQTGTGNNKPLTRMQDALPSPYTQEEIFPLCTDLSPVGKVTSEFVQNG